MDIQSFDTHKYIKQFQKVGFEEEQAETIVKVLVETRDFDLSNLATKTQLDAAKQELKQEIKVLEEKFNARISLQESTIIKWNIATIIAISGIILAILKLTI